MPSKRRRLIMSPVIKTLVVSAPAAPGGPRRGPAAPSDPPRGPVCKCYKRGLHPKIAQRAMASHSKWNRTNYAPPERIRTDPKSVQRAKASRPNWTPKQYGSPERIRTYPHIAEWAELFIQNGPAHFSGPPGRIRTDPESLKKAKASRSTWTRTLSGPTRAGPNGSEHC